MADKIDQLTLNGTSYDIDLPPDATPSIASITTSGDVTVGGSITKNGNAFTLPSSGGELALISDIPSVPSNVAKTNVDNNFSVSQTMAGADVSSGTLKVNVLQAKTSSSAATYGVGTSGQVLKSNGTNAYWGSDSSDTTSQGMGGNYKWKNPMAGYQIFITGRDNKLVPMVTGASGTASTGTSKTMNTQAFDPFGLIGYTSSSSYKAADVLCSSSTWLATASLDLRYSFNCGSTLTANAPVYIVAQVQSDGTATLSSPYYSQTLPSSADGKIYIYLGQAISTTNLNLQNDHPIYQYVDGSLKQYTGSSSGGGGGLTLLYSGYCSDITGSSGTQIGSSGLYAISGYIEDLESLTGSVSSNDKLFIEVIDGNVLSSNIFLLAQGDGQYTFCGIWDTTIDYAIQENYDEMKIYKLG